MLFTDKVIGYTQYRHVVKQFHLINDLLNRFLFHNTKHVILLEDDGTASSVFCKLNVAVQ
jgi:hypothetical protein